eukprot:TRINITY_DN38788_c0_g1_i1.p1 TRINITY_DN38788_c0_g1~~TRINITY_DN38788_c0_g1_i1.p1  ORF type:complete len:284 (-),score=46.79 TRINITY_DN38788_c0_g1_i1:28-879(-)
MTASDAAPSRTRTIDILPQLSAASLACSAVIIEFTIPQIIKLSQTTALPLPLAPFQTRMLIMGRALGPQTAITALQFVAVRELRDALDAALGPRPVNLSLAYGAASVPLIAGKYNLLFADVYHHFKAAPPEVPNETRMQFWTRQWETKVRPGLLWSYLRDTCSIGGAIVLGPMVAARLNALVMAGSTAERKSDEALPKPGRLLQFFSGFLTGCGTGLATQVFHNAALTGGRMAGLGERPSNMTCMRQLFAEQGMRALYLNFPMRVGVIAGWSAILNVTQPFRT